MVPMFDGIVLDVNNCSHIIVHQYMNCSPAKRKLEEIARPLRI